MYHTLHKCTAKSANELQASRVKCKLHKMYHKLYKRTVDSTNKMVSSTKLTLQPSYGC